MLVLLKSIFELCFPNESKYGPLLLSVIDDPKIDHSYSLWIGFILGFKDAPV